MSCLFHNSANVINIKQVKHYFWTRLCEKGNDYRFPFYLNMMAHCKDFVHKKFFTCLTKINFMIKCIKVTDLYCIYKCN